MKTKLTIRLLNTGIMYACRAARDAESLHDDVDGEMYMDSVQYETMTEAEDFMKESQDEISRLKDLLVGGT